MEEVPHGASAPDGIPVSSDIRSGPEVENQNVP